MDGTICHRISRTEWSPRLKGHMVVLGKQFVLREQILCDSPARIAEAKALLTAILRQAQDDTHRLVYISAIRRALG